MKKVTNITAFAILAIAVMSCGKTSQDYFSAASTQHTTIKQEPVKIRIISDWQNLSFTSTTMNGVSQLEGQSMLTQIISYETGMHKQLAYVKKPGRDGPVYRSLPTTYPATDGNLVFNFSLDFSTFKVSISNTDFPARQLNPQNFEGIQYRYIVIPVEVYQGLQIDWNDITAVAQALNFSL